jgi:hypothetical protein
VAGRDNYALAYREAKSSAVAALATNDPAFGPGKFGMRFTSTRRQEHPKQFQRLEKYEEQQQQQQRPLVRLLQDHLHRCTTLTRSQSTDFQWFILRVLRLTSTASFSLLTAAQGGLLEDVVQTRTCITLGLRFQSTAELVQLLDAVSDDSVLKNVSIADLGKLCKTLLALPSIVPRTQMAAVRFVLTQSA